MMLIIPLLMRNGLLVSTVFSFLAIFDWVSQLAACDSEECVGVTGKQRRHEVILRFGGAVVCSCQPFPPLQGPGLTAQWR